MKILATADWHLGPLPGPTVNGKNTRAEDTLRCVDELIEKATAIWPDIIIHSGDVFNVAKTWSERGINEVQDAIERIERLSRIAPVVVIQGTRNHDGSQHFEMLKKYFESNLDVHIITEPGVSAVQSHAGPVSICALPGFDKGYFRAKNPGIDRIAENEIFTDALEKMIIGMRAQCTDGIPSILVGHYTVEGANTESGQLMMFSQFEPIITQRTLVSANYDLCCFGHIHRPQALGSKAFYCGAVNRLNFNDIDQERGFYIHTLNGLELVNSEFIKLDSPRRFVSLRMNDEDIGDFNLTGQLHYDKRDVKDAIVRVLYECTDEHNKALDRSALERALTDCGAFWVQEVTPTNITVTVDRTELTAENDPMQNLVEYLSGKIATGAITQDDANDATEMGRAIIDRVLANGHNDKANGLFTPVEISVTNYRNYREESFNFDAVRFATINGQNGVGKSSLFMDAIYDALFEEPREGDLTGWISNDPSARSGAIIFTFRVGATLWRVSRTRVKSGKATLNLAECVDGEWVDRSCEKLRDTQQAIERVIGMNGQTLRACALIMQDQYGLFLQAGKEERMQILSDILGLGIYDAMSQEASEGAAEANRDIRIIQARHDDLDRQRLDLDYLRQRRDDIETGVNSCGTRLDKLNNDLNALNERLTSLNTTAEVYALYRRQIDELRAELARAEAQKVAAEKDRDSFAAILASQSEILDGAERYRIAAFQRESLQDRVATFAALKEKLASIDSAIHSALDSQQQNVNRAMEIEGRIEKLKALIGCKEEYERQIAERDQISAAIEAAEETNLRRFAADREAEKASVKLAEARLAARANYRERAAEIDAAKKRVALLENSRCPVAETATCRFLADAIAARDILPDLEQKQANATEAARIELAALEDALKAAETARDAIQRVDEAVLSQMRARQRELSGASVMLAQIVHYAEELALQETNLKAANDRDNALTFEIETKRSERAQMEAEITEYEEAYKCYGQVMEDVKKYRPYVEKEQQLAGAKDRMDAAQERVNECLRRTQQIRAHIADREALLANDAATDAERREVMAAIDVKKGEIASANVERERLIGDKARVMSEIERAEELTRQINELAKEASGKGHTAAIYELLKQAFGPNGIPHNIMRSIIPVFEATASNILSQMTGGKMSVELVTEKTLKSNAKKEITTLDVVINDADTGRLPYLSRSGGERVKACLSVILALAEVMKSKLGVQVGFLFVDEPAYLDAEGTQYYVSALETIQRRYQNVKVMAISHDESFRSRFPQTITVFKDDVGSHAVMD